MAPVSGPRGASRSRTAGSAGGRAQRRHILEAGSTGLGDGPSADGGGEDMSKVMSRVLACQWGARRGFPEEWDQIWEEDQFSLRRSPGTRETSKAIGMCGLDVQERCLG